MSKKYIDYEDAIKSLEFLGKIVIAEEHGVSPLRSSLHSPSYDTVRDYIKRTNKALTPPTEEEVCKAYANQYHCGLLYNRKLKEFVEIKGGRSRGKIIARKVGECLEFPHPIHSHLITLLGRFYEGLSDVNE